ncbi:C-glycoside deglycosidase beta subunit domain-containing protein [Streptococcus orisratti]|uniref:C-glycoside deglycosidase beta subunit domain-containing protein n=1 Tax=Streptococcus orisratti TaxID=114652 RepID=UPI0003A9D60E|nr:DUF6379 domain-containing protein [Streptococcus orisratti]
MLESNVIQYRGFHSIIENDKIVGFQICVRSDYYRGVWLSQLRPGKVIVDDVTYTKEEVIWEINGKDYKVDELARASQGFWRITDVATLKIMKKVAWLKVFMMSQLDLRPAALTCHRF